MTTLQKEVLAMHMNAAKIAVKFAGDHPKETKMRKHFCPVHMFNETHHEKDCLVCQGLTK